MKLNEQLNGLKFGIEMEMAISSYAYDEESCTCDIEDDFECDFCAGSESITPQFTLSSGWSAKEEHCGIEIISPPLLWPDGFMSVENQIAFIGDVHKKVKFSECGLHVHVDIGDFTLGNLKTLVLLANKFDIAMYSFLHPSRYSNRYCYHLDYKDRDIKTAISIDNLCNLQPDYRYSGLNLYSFGKHGTVEFRYCHGTLDRDFIHALLILYLSMVNFAKRAPFIPRINKSTPKKMLTTLLAIVGVDDVSSATLLEAQKRWSKEYREFLKGKDFSYSMSETYEEVIS